MANYEQLQNFVNLRKAKRQSDFDAAFWETKIRNIMANSGTFNVKDKTISAPVVEIPDANSSWAEYTKAVASRGLKPNYEQFLQQYNNLKDVRTSALLNNLTSAQASGMSMKDIRKAIKKDPEIQRLLKEGIVANPDSEVKATLGAYLPKQKRGFMDALKTPLIAGGAAAGTFLGPKAYAMGKERFMSALDAERGPRALREAKELTGKTIDPKDAKKINKARYETYKKGLKKKQPMSFENWSKKNKTPKLWTEKTLTEAETLFGKDKAKDLGLYKPRPGKAKAAKAILGRGIGRGLLGAGKFAAITALLNALTSEE
tara:strand:- start:7 stop:954 length:948 start_codon:yes stop_codon:yes gene_type:complete